MLTDLENLWPKIDDNEKETTIKIDLDKDTSLETTCEPDYYEDETIENSALQFCNGMIEEEDEFIDPFIENYHNVY